MNTFHAKKIAIVVSLGFTSVLMASSALAQTLAQSEDLKNNGLVISSLQAPPNTITDDSATVKNRYNLESTNLERPIERPMASSMRSSMTSIDDTTKQNAYNSISRINNTTNTTSNIDSNVNGNGKLVQIGEANGNLQPLKGFAKDLPLITVLKQITPNGWVVKKNDSSSKKLDIQQLVSWDGGKSWLETLSDISRQYNVNTLVNWDAKEITLSPVSTLNNVAVSNINTIKKEEVRIGSDTASLPKPKTGVFELAGSETIAVGASQATTLSVPAPVVQQTSNWVLDSNKTLKENVESWGKNAGYRVVWSGEDYPVDDSRSLAGDFDGDNGPIKQLSFDYGPKSRVQQPLTFQFFQNRTLVIENYKFEQQGFPQYSQ